MGTRQEHEEGLARFIHARSKSRFKESLGNPKMREKLRKALGHYQKHLDERHASLEEQHTLHDVHVQHVYSRLLAAGAPDVCVAFTNDTELDGEMPLYEAVERLMWVGAGFLSCVPGKLALYVSEDGSDAYVLRRE